MMENKSADTIPLAMSEKRSHVISLGIFCIFMILYAGIAIYAFSNVDSIRIKALDIPKNIDNDFEEKDICYPLNDPFAVVNQLVKNGLKRNNFFYLFDYSFNLIATHYEGTNKYMNSRFDFFFCKTVSLIILVIFLRIVSKIPSTLLKIMTVMNVILCVDLIVTLIYEEISESDIIKILIVNLNNFWNIFNILYAIDHFGFKLISEVIKESSRAIRTSSNLILLTLLSSILISLVANLTFNVYTTLVILETVNPNQDYFKILKYLNFVSGMWLCSFIWNFTKIVCAKTFSTWFYKTYKSSLSYSTPEESIVTTLRYHLGTVAYMSSLGAVFVFIITIIKNLRNKAPQTRYSTSIMIMSYWNTFWMLLNGSCVMTAIQGTNFKKSADSVCQLYLKNPWYFYATTKGCTWCITGLSSFFFSIYIFGNGMGKDYQELATSLFCLIFPAILLIESAVSTITICFFKEFEHDEQTLTKPSFMYAKLKDITKKRL